MFLSSYQFLWVLYACNDDDDQGVTVVPPPDRGEKAIEDDAVIVQYLETHFYNYESFENPQENFDYSIVIDTIADSNSDKIPLLDQVTIKTIKFQDVDQKLYILNVQEGVGQKATVADSVAVIYKGQLLDGRVFDSSVTPVYFDLPGVNALGQFTGVVEGFRQGLAGFGGATDIAIGGDGGILVSNDHGIGAIFIPSGLAYYVQDGPGIIGPYEPIIFTFKVIQINDTDHDRDFLGSINEDLNANDNLYDDDTDNDGLPNYLDSDDDGDGTQTRDEITVVDLNGDGIITLNEITFYDDDGDGIKNHLDPDDRDSKNE